VGQFIVFLDAPMDLFMQNPVDEQDTSGLPMQGIEK
jgi:hypothetical protein